ncbi:MAG TPA: sensor histidine kinase, partial [Longimicrobiales bacterium]
MDASRAAQGGPSDEHIDPRILWPLLALFWVGSIAATMAQVYASTRLGGSQPSFLDLVRWVLPGYLVWLASMPVIVFVLARRFRFEHGQWRRSAPVHLLASLVIAFGVLTVDTLGAIWRGSERPFTTIMIDIARGWLLWLVFTYWFFLVFVLAIRHYTTAAARRLRETRLEAALAATRLAVLRTQLHPHFLFNTLNSISSLIDEDPAVARRMIAQVGDLLRASLTDGDGEWTLEREIELLERYTEIERMRFGERLRIDVSCEPEALAARVPSLLLQPLVENAILHGIQPALNGG